MGLCRLSWCQDLTVRRASMPSRSRALGLRPGHHRGPSPSTTAWTRSRPTFWPRRHHVCARRPVDGRLHRLCDRARGAGAGGAAGAARYLARPRHGRAERAPARADRARRGRAILEAADLLFPVFVHRNRQGDAALQRDRAHHGRGNRAAGLRAPAARDHDAAGLPPAALVYPLSDAGAGRRRRRAHAARACPRRSPPALRAAVLWSCPTAGISRRWSGRRR